MKILCFEAEVNLLVVDMLHLHTFIVMLSDDLYDKYPHVSWPPKSSKVTTVLKFLCNLYTPVKWYRCHWDFCRDFCYWEQNFEGLQNCSFEFWFFLDWTVHVRRPCKNGWTDREVLWHEDSGGRKEPYIWWGPGCPMRRGNFRGKDTPGHAQRHSAVSCAKMDELIEMSFGLWTRVGPRKHLLCGSPDPSMGRGNIEGEGDPL